MLMWAMVFCVTVCGAADDPAAGPAEVVREGFKFTEGPVWSPMTGLLFSDIPADTIYRADGTAFRSPSGKSNGLAVDREGRLVACEHGNRRVSRTEKDGTILSVADRYLGKRLNSPNDLAIRSDGMIFFTDPPYGLENRERELPFCGVYAVTTAGEVRLLSVYFKSPNGLAFSPDEKTLYVGDSEDGFIEAFDVDPAARLSNARLFATVATPDGMKVDDAGRLWVAAKDGICVYGPDGVLLQTVAFPHQPTNCGFGDADGKTLYVTARPGVYKVRCAVSGLRTGK